MYSEICGSRYYFDLVFLTSRYREITLYGSGKIHLFLPKVLNIRFNILINKDKHQTEI